MVKKNEKNSCKKTSAEVKVSEENNVKLSDGENSGVEVTKNNDATESKKEKPAEAQKKKSRLGKFILFILYTTFVAYVGMIFGSITPVEKIPFGEGAASFMKPLMDQKEKEISEKKTVKNMTVYNEIPQNDINKGIVSLADAVDENPALKKKLAKKTQDIKKSDVLTSVDFDNQSSKKEVFLPKYNEGQITFFKKRLSKVAQHVLAAEFWQKDDAERQKITAFQTELETTATLDAMKKQASHVLPMVLKLTTAGAYKSVKTFPARTEGLSLLASEYANFVANDDARLGDVTLLYVAFLVSHDQKVMEELLVTIKEVCK